VADPTFYQSAFGGLQLWISKISTNKSRTQVVHSPSAGDDHIVQDRGRELLEARISLLFARMIGDDLEPIDRLKRFSALVDDKPRLFTHPIEGTFLARAKGFNYDIDDSGIITGDVELIQVGEVQAVTVAGADALQATGEGAVAQASAKLENELAEIELESTLPGEAVVIVDRWAAADEVNPRDVLTETGSLTEELGDLASTLDGDIGSWSAYKAVILLSEAVRAAAASAMADSASTFAVRIGAPIALRALVASIYGADEADQRYSQALALNDIASPAWLEPGIEMMLPTPTARARNG
jgi:hypothetical protein